MTYVFKSDEERNFAAWLDEAFDAGLIEHWEYEPRSYELVPRQTVKSKNGKKDVFLFQPSRYTPDFHVVLTAAGKWAFRDLFRKTLHVNVHSLWLDVKGSYDPYRKDDRFISLIRKIMYQQYKVYITKVIVDKAFFMGTWAPEPARYCDKKKDKDGNPALNTLGKQAPVISQFMAAIPAEQGELL